MYIHKDLNTSFGKDNFIGLHFFDAKAKSDSEETTGELSLYTHLTVSEAYDYQKCPDIPKYPGLPNDI